ncbi:TauD/TfdA family dioxygenase [Endozoicomonas sp. YOMI1]|uniref:TauD/TfdA family dioxygenase n=1 Tax=Endozoicomonas sp. YOMI1 TaxID=2828739 RepID=UPI002148EBF0|nr:TauD/TfdA family dioxygenase [Endozoicomonas sp. YOMI1]
MICSDITLPEAVSKNFEAIAQGKTIEQLEQQVLENHNCAYQALDSDEWLNFTLMLQQVWQQNDHAIVRGKPDQEGNTAVLLGLALNSRFKPYRGNKVLKHFRMSPWTTELSQTLKEGHFHTDLCTAQTPPKVTLIQCRVADPSPGKGILRVARLEAILIELKRIGADATLDFLLKEECELVDERAHGSYQGVMANHDTIRYHPETLRAAYRRKGMPLHELERHLATIHEVALMTSTPIDLQSGDALLVSNTRALHYRSACSVRYLEFPRKFEAREIYVLHLLDSPAWPI